MDKYVVTFLGATVRFSSLGKAMDFVRSIMQADGDIMGEISKERMEREEAEKWQSQF